MSKFSLLGIATVTALMAAGGIVLAAAPAQTPATASPAAVAPSTAPATAPANAPGRARRGGGEGENEGGGRVAGGVRGGRGAAAPAGLENAMSDMNRTLQALKRDSADPANHEQTLHDLYTLERDVAIAKLLAPPSTNRMNADDRAKAIESYRAMMTMLTRQLLDLEDAVAMKKPDDIKKGIAELDRIEQQGHSEFNVRPDD